MDTVDRTLTTLRKNRATGTGNQILFIFHVQQKRNVITFGSDGRVQIT
jgi:hypothetical protein